MWSMGQKSAPLPYFRKVQQPKEIIKAKNFSAKVIRGVANVYVKKKSGGLLALSSCDIMAFSAGKIRSII